MLERYEQIEQEIEDESSEKYDFPTKFEWDSSDKVSCNHRVFQRKIKLKC